MTLRYTRQELGSEESRNRNPPKRCVLARDKACLVRANDRFWLHEIFRGHL